MTEHEKAKEIDIVRRHLRGINKEAGSLRKKLKELYLERSEIFAELYQSGLSTKKIAAKFRTSSSAVAKSLAEQGVKIRSKASYRNTELENRIVELRDKGYTFREISKRIPEELTVSNISRIYHRWVQESR